MKKSFYLLTILLLLLAPTACRKARKIHYADISYKGKPYHIIPDQSYSTPKLIPSDMPIYSKSTFLYESKITKDVLFTSFETKEVPMAVTNFYREELKNKGWTLQPATQNEALEALIARKNNTIILITARDSPEIEATIISIIYDSKANQN